MLWMRNAGKILCAGDSITVGFLSLTGGWRKKLFSDLAAADIRFTAVGPYTTDSSGMTAAAHRGLSGDRAQNARDNIGATATSSAPDVIIYGFGMNDMGNGRTSAQYLADLNACIDACQAARPNALHIIQTLIYPTSAAPDYFANLAQYQAAQAALPALAASQGATLANVGQPALSDGVHPSDGSAGYNAMADAIKAALLLAIA